MYVINHLPSKDYISSFSDPRLISSAHSGQRIQLDAPVLTGKVKMSDVYKLNHTSRYNSLADIQNGNITYYYDKDQLVPFFQPLFAKSLVTRVDYIDPMGTYKPHYSRYPTCVRKSGLTSLDDTQQHRDDILAANMWKRNQTEPLLKSGWI